MKNIVFYLILMIFPVYSGFSSPQESEKAPGEEAYYEEEALEPGMWSLSTDGRYITIHTYEADIKKVLGAIQDLTPAEFNIRKLPNKTLSVKYTDVELERVLSSIGVNYMLSYSRNEETDELILERAYLNRTAAKGGPRKSGPTTSSAGVSSYKGESLKATYGGLTPAQIIEGPGFIGNADVPLEHMTMDGDVSDWPEEIPWQRVSGDAPLSVGGDGTLSPGVNNIVGIGDEPNEDTDASMDMAAVLDGDKLRIAVKIKDDKLSFAELDDLEKFYDDYLRLTIKAGDTKPISMRMLRHHVQPKQHEDGTITTQERQNVAHYSGLRSTIVPGPDGWTIEAEISMEDLGITDGNTKFTIGSELGDSDEGEDRVQKHRGFMQYDPAKKEAEKASAP